MYCVFCGVQLTDGEKQCPLCQTKVYHPELVCREVECLYPGKKYPTKQANSIWVQMVLSVAVLLSVFIVLLCDLQINQGITWSGIVIGALLVGYVILILPAWFQTCNPVIFVPCDFVVIGLYLLYINLVTDGNWFFGFAFPLVGGVGLIVTAVVTLLRYVRRGKLYIFGGASIAMGAFMLVMEFLVNYTFHYSGWIGWSLYPLAILVLLGGLLIFLAICRPARECMERKFFI